MHLAPAQNLHCYNNICIHLLLSQHAGNITRKPGLKARNKLKVSDDLKCPDKATAQKTVQMNWNDEKADGNEMPYVNQSNVDFSAYHNLDYINFEPMPVSLFLVL
jgi:hypothetical protein